MKPVLVDTTVWIEFLGAKEWRHRSTMVRLLESDAARIADVSVAELLYGARGPRERRAVLNLAAGLPPLAQARDLWIAAGDIGRTWRSRGRTLSLADCALAALCQANDLALWTEDQDFDPLVDADVVARFSPP